MYLLPAPHSLSFTLILATLVGSKLSVQMEQANRLVSLHSRTFPSHTVSAPTPRRSRYEAMARSPRSARQKGKKSMGVDKPRLNSNGGSLARRPRRNWVKRR
ncbi:hypothetical protein P171DRAFT_511336 [Karstenula rhodostoma CBS 690.94]|uniref:Secreted protein n=1 Tax=Karstenula rhodostoma CBS 690.94 TaxID=1392251 RepID=A0A9P4PPU4_9PLEO|nr:hypothetical protein P171DRAFT_511336 [Karstenula rhodostoma CBS 690.94]